ncbi:MarR family transcriptional regulator [Nocardia carnea]|uniref:MarR family transcriptional regulator n=1 Tax=Nocardia carnea TaxID=37328 RepID=UPI0024589AEA|nr:helix-turn-helix domain-containing protein [Nocardia carnea]
MRRSGPPYRLTTRQIAARSLVTAGAISQRLARAEAAGLITRSPAPARPPPPPPPPPPPDAQFTCRPSPQYRARSAFLSGLPSGLTGMLSAKSTVFGV